MTEPQTRKHRLRRRVRGIALPRLADVRYARGMTQRQLAERIGVVPTTVANIEQGVTKAGFKTAHRLADALGTTVDELRGPAPDA
jgi:transcriptional regulator with XRE-family HTH domain